VSRDPWGQAQRNLTAAIAEVEAAAVDTQSQAGAHLASTARGLAPVETGRLKQGISDDGSGRVSSAAPYSAFVHEGTDDTRAEPFLRVAAAATVPVIAPLLRANVETRLRALQGRLRGSQLRP